MSTTSASSDVSSPSPSPSRGEKIIKILGGLFAALFLLLIVSALVYANSDPTQRRGKEARASSDFYQLSKALGVYRAINGAYPTTEQGLDALVEQPIIGPVPENWQPIPLKNGIPDDPWGNPIQYKSDGISFTLSSLGPDRVASEDDVKPNPQFYRVAAEAKASDLEDLEESNTSGHSCPPKEQSPATAPDPKGT